MKKISKKTPDARSGRAGIRKPPPAPVLDPLLQLQQTAGNQAVQGLLRTHALQPKLKVSQPEDAHEQEADQMAQQVASSISASTLEPAVDNLSEGISPSMPEGTGASHQTEAAEASVPDDFADSLGTGQPLDQTTRSLMEARLGQDFGEVRVHTDEQSAASAREIEASAYTLGRDIVFEKGEYAPETARGKRLLAHELTHVAQGDAGKTSATLHRKTKGETMKEKADVFLSTDANLKVEVDVLKAAISEIKQGKSVEFNKKAGIKRIRNAAKILALDAAETTALEETWERLVDNRKSSGTKKYKADEQSFFSTLRSPLTELGESFPKSQAKYWLKNTAPQMVDIIFQSADADLPADELYAYAMKEGLVDYVRGKIGLADTDSPTAAQLKGVSTTDPVSGFGFLGLDDFMTDLAATRDPLKDFLPKGFDLTKVTEEKNINEKKREVRSGKFPDMTMAIQAMAAALKRKRKLFKEDATANGYAAPTRDELVYWTYVYFNSGEFGGKAQLEKYKGKRTLSDWITKNEYPNAIKLLESWQMIKKMNLF